MRAYKPVLTGLEDHAEIAARGDWPADHELLAATAGMGPEEVAPLRYGPAVSPHLAAQLAGERIDPVRLLAAARGDTSGAGGSTLIVEGVGGLLDAAGRRLHGVRSGCRARAGRADRRAARASARSTTRCSRCGPPARPALRCARWCSRRGPPARPRWSAPTARRSRGWARCRWSSWVAWRPRTERRSRGQGRSFWQSSGDPEPQLRRS